MGASGGECASIRLGGGMGAMKGAADAFFDEEGFTTAGMAVALLLTLSLIFSAAQVYRVNSAAAQVQDVADAAALAAENQVAEFMLVARLCDAVLLTMSLTGLVLTGAGIVALCVPAAATAGDALLSAARHVLDARNRFGDEATRVLDELQRLLPFLAAARAAGVAQANNASSTGAEYLGVAVLVPGTGESLSLAADDGASELADEARSRSDDIKEDARRAEEAAHEAAEAKQRGFEADCGRAPEPCMAQRASALAGLAAEDNPVYRSVDTWSFGVGLERARTYYRARRAQEAPRSSKLDERCRSYLRAQFYAFASEELAGAFILDAEDAFAAQLPHFPHDTETMRSSRLYWREAFPVSGADDGGLWMHACPACPNAAGAIGVGSVAQMEREGFSTCPLCSFTAQDLGRVAAASSSIENGFEFHYERFVRAAEDYARARSAFDPLANEVRGEAGGLIERLKNELSAVAGRRIHAKPPGARGAVAFVVNRGETLASTGFSSSLAASSGVLGPRAAVAGATLLEDSAEEGRTALNALLDGLNTEGGAPAAQFVLDCWSALLGAYGAGQRAIESGVSDTLDELPLAGAAGLGSWAAGELSDAVCDIGLEPADLAALKPVLVNSGHVADPEDGAFSAGYIKVKSMTASHPLMSADLFSSILADVETTGVGAIESLDGSVEVASIEFFGPDGPSIPVRIPVPRKATDSLEATVRDLVGRIRSFYVETAQVSVWD